MPKYLKTEGILAGDSGVFTLVYSKMNDIVALYLSPWRQNGGEWVHDKQLNIEIRATKAYASRTFQKWKEGEGIRIDAKKPKPAKHFKNVVESKGLLPIRTIVLKDVPIAKKSGPPATFVFPKLGKLKYDEGVEGYSKWRAIGGAKYELSLMPKNLKKLKEEMLSAEKHLFAIERKFGTIITAATRKLLPIYNKKWREDAPILSAAAFTKKLKPASISIGAKGSGSMILECGELFGDHGIEITLGAGGKPTQIALA